MIRYCPTRKSYSMVVVPIKIFSILVDIPSLIKSEWVEIASIDGVQVGGSSLNSCNRTVERKEGGTWYYGHNHGGASEFETMAFATQCVSNNVDSWSYSQWAVVDAGILDVRVGEQRMASTMQELVREPITMIIFVLLFVDIEFSI